MCKRIHQSIEPMLEKTDYIVGNKIIYITHYETNFYIENKTNKKLYIDFIKKYRTYLTPGHNRISLLGSIESFKITGNIQQVTKLPEPPPRPLEGY